MVAFGITEVSRQQQGDEMKTTLSFTAGIMLMIASLVWGVRADFDDSLVSATSYDIGAILGQA
jgi:zinc transporter ZupT